MPDLELFSNAGYPFTRMADLSETAVVLPDTPMPDEIEMYLTLMGHFGAQTGYPVLNVTVTNNEGMTTDRSKDYIVMGTVDDQPALGKLNKVLPVQVDNGNLHIQDTQGFFAPLAHAWWKVRSSDHIQSGQLQTEGGLPDALIEGVEWPSGSSRSVVLIALRDHSVVPKFLNTFLKYSQYSDISQSVAVLHATASNPPEGDPTDPNPRSLIGLSKTARFLYFVAIDGRIPGYTTGTTNAGSAALMIAIGADRALNLDGGGSTEIVRADPGQAPYILTNPSGQTQRVDISAIGFTALPLPSQALLNWQLIDRNYFLLQQLLRSVGLGG